MGERWKMTEWLKRLRGYVKIRVWGFAPQRFINLCSNKGILLWNIEKQDDVYIMCVSLESFYRLRSIARKTKVRVVISERYGLPFFCRICNGESIPGRTGADGHVLDRFFHVCMGYPNIRQLCHHGWHDISIPGTGRNTDGNAKK